MKSIFTICLGMLLPIVLLAQETFSNLHSRNPLSIPYLFAEKNQHVSDKMISIYKAYSTFNNPSTSELPVKQRLDSIITAPVDSAYSNRKSSFTYNNNGQQTSKSEYVWDATAQAWYNISKIEWTYDLNRNNISYITYYGEELNWFNELKFENSFDQNFRLLKTEGYGWELSTSQWEIGSKVENNYNGDGQLTTTIFYEWDAQNNLWKSVSKYEYEYNTNGQIVVATEFEWQGQWINKHKGEFTYYVFGKELSFIFYVWDGFSMWGNSFKSETQYNGNLKLTNLTEYNWDLISVIWVNSKKTEYKYDSENNMNQSIFSKWVKQLQGFIIESKEEGVYSYAYLFDDLVLAPDLKFSQTTARIPDNEIYFNNMLTKYSYFLHNGTIYLADDNKSFYYSPITITKITDPSAFEIQIVPNPANSNFTIIADNWVNAADFKLFDLNGRQIISRKVNTNEGISIEYLSKGMYLYRMIFDEKKIHTGSLIIN